MSHKLLEGEGDMFGWLLALILALFAWMNFNIHADPKTDTGGKVKSYYERCIKDFTHKTPEQRRVDCFGEGAR